MFDRRIATSVMIAVLLVLSALAAGASAAPEHGAEKPLNPVCYSVLTPPTGSLATVSTQSQPGVYLWLDQSAWHIRVVHPGSSRYAFTGEISGCTPMHVAEYLFQSGDYVKQSSADPGVVQFQMLDFGQLDGFEFNADCPTTFTFNLNANGAPIPASDIYIGALNVHPPASTFALPACGESADPNSPVNLHGTVGSDLGNSGPSITLPHIPLLTVPNLTATFQRLQLPVASRPLFGDPGANVANVAKLTRPSRDIPQSLAVFGEIALVLVIVGLFLLSRRERRSRA